MMKDIEIVLKNEPGNLALIGETLGNNNISLEGGGVFSDGEKVIAHFLVDDAQKAKEVLESVGIHVLRINDIVIQKLKQDIPGQLGLFCRKLADSNVNILAQYSDHSSQLILVVDNIEKAKEISRIWMDNFNLS